MAELKELAEFYARAAAMKDPVMKFDGRLTGNIGPGISGSITRWTVEERQPDFQCLIDSGIDCEFSDNLEKKWYVGKLKRVSCRGVYVAHDDSIWERCRPRLNHPHAWIAKEDSKCPVPEGYQIKAYFGDPNIKSSGYATKYDWTSSAGHRRILAFEVLPKAEENK